MSVPEPRPGDTIRARGSYGYVEGECVRVQDVYRGGREVVVEVTVPISASMHWAVPMDDIEAIAPRIDIPGEGRTWVVDAIDVCDNPSSCRRIGVRHARVEGKWRHQVLVNPAHAAPLIERNRQGLGSALRGVE